MKTGNVQTVAALVLGVMTLAAAAQSSPLVKDDLFNGTEIFAKGASDVNEITMDPDTLGMVGGKDKSRAHTMVLNVVRTYSYDKPGMYRVEDMNAFRDKLNTGDWHCSVHTRSLKTGESTDVCNKRRGDDMVETAIITVEPKELTFIHTIRKRSAWETQGEMDGGVPLAAMRGLPMMAMLDPEAMVDMKIAMAATMAKLPAIMAEAQAGMRSSMSVNMAQMQGRIAAAQKAMPKIDSREVQKRVDDALKARHDAETQREDDKQPE